MKAPAPKNETSKAPAPNYNLFVLAEYYKRHLELCMIEKTQQDAWEKLEEEYAELAKSVGLQKQYRYRTYDSFRNAKTIYYQCNR